MKHPDNKFPEANIHWREGLPVSREFDDVYFSRASGIAETRYVFLQQNRLPERWLENSRETFTIGETGFGTGLNFLTAASLWLQHRPGNTLHFVSAEKFPLSKADLEQSLQLWPELAELGDELLDQYPHAIAGVHRLKLAGGSVLLTLLYGDAAEMFSSLKGSDHPMFSRIGNPVIDAWFLDGFAPAKNPQMWTGELFQAIADLSDSGTTFSTFTAAGVVRRGMLAAGFATRKVEGFGDKREMLCGEMTEAPQKVVDQSQLQPAIFNASHQPPWYLLCRPAKPDAAIVIGGGIAGCATARALAERGIRVTLIERHKDLAQEGSGNPQGILYPKLSHKSSPLARFGLAALSNAIRFHRQHLNACGLLVLAEPGSNPDKFSKITQSHPESLVKLIGGETLQVIAGLELACEEALYFPELGWINPADVCESLVSHPAISLLRAEVASIRQNRLRHWHALDAKESVIASAEVMVIACATNTARFSQTAHLPLKAIRGQISTVPETTASSRLKTVICGEGYLAPAVNGHHTLGATYDLNNTDTGLREEDHHSNLRQLAATDPDLGEIFSGIDTGRISGRAAVRCTTPDYLPIAGPAPVLESYLEDYALLKKNARSHIPLLGRHWQGLYLNCGHGSRGMSYAPLCAELLASQICAEVPPMELDLRKVIHPGRFIIRDLKRNKI